MLISRVRAVLYKIAKYLGDIDSVLRFRIGRRVGYRIGGKISGRVMRWLFR